MEDHVNHICGVAATIHQMNMVCDGLAGSLIVKMVESSPRETVLKTHLCVWNVQMLSTEFPDRELDPCKNILVKGSNED